MIEEELGKRKKLPHKKAIKEHDNVRHACKHGHFLFDCASLSRAVLCSGLLFLFCFPFEMNHRSAYRVDQHCCPPFQRSLASLATKEL